MVQIPEILDFNLLSVTVCACLGEAEVNDSVIVLKKKTYHTTQWTSAYLHVGEDNKHSFLHVDIEVDEEKEDPDLKRSGTKSAFERIVKEFSGTKASTSVNGLFIIPRELARFSRIIQLDSTDVDQGDASVRIVSANMMVTGLPFHRCDWTLIPNDDPKNEVLEIRVFGRSVLTISDRYLDDAVGFLTKSLSVICPKKVKHASRKKLGTS